MANYEKHNASGIVVTHKASGVGSDADPYVDHVNIDSAAVADGDDVTQGAIADAAVDGDAAGTVNAHLRGISKKLAAGVALTTSTAAIGKLVTTPFSESDSITRPNNATAVALNKSINCDVKVTALAYTGLVVTLTAANAFAVGDRITVAGVNAGFTVTNVDGNWICKTGTNATTVVFDVLVQPTGTTPQTVTAGTIAKMLSMVVVPAVGQGFILSRLSVSLPGVGMTGAIRVWLYTAQTTVTVDAGAFTLLVANDGSRRDYFDLYPVTSGAGSDGTFASVRLWETFVCAAADTRIYARIEGMGAGTPAANGVVTLRMSGLLLQG